MRFLPFATRPPRSLRRWAVHLLAVVACAPPLLAQQPAGRPPTWAELAAAPGVRAEEIAWLEGNLTPAERQELVALVGALSAPEAAQIMASYLYADGSVLVPFTNTKPLADTLFQRPPAGTAGLARVAYLAGRLRAETIAGWGRLGVYAFDFRGAPLGDVATPRRTAAAPGVALRLTFDFAPAETLLALVSTPDVTPAEAMRRLDAPAFDALLAHRGQGFYQLPWTRELMAVNVARAASTLPLDRLYAFANPKGFLDYADVSRHRARYRALLDTLRAREGALLGDVAGRIAPYLPAGTRLERTVSLYFAEGADGWARDEVAAVDLEWFKDDYARLRTTLTHETFHAAQQAARRPAPPGAGAGSPADSVLRGALEQLFEEGTANYVAPTRDMPAAERAAAVRAGAALLDTVVAALAKGTADGRAAAQGAIQRGVAGAGPFYWLGAAMSAAIADALGPRALAATLRDGGVAFAQSYLRAAARSPGAPSLLPATVAAAVRRLPAPAQR